MKRSPAAASRTSPPLVSLIEAPAATPDAFAPGLAKSRVKPSACALAAAATGRKPLLENSCPAIADDAPLVEPAIEPRRPLGSRYRVASPSPASAVAFLYVSSCVM